MIAITKFIGNLLDTVVIELTTSVEVALPQQTTDRQYQNVEFMLKIKGVKNTHIYRSMDDKALHITIKNKGVEQKTSAKLEALVDI